MTTVPRTWYSCATARTAAQACSSLSLRAMQRLGRRLQEEAGQSMVELALALPILVFGLIGGADMARAYALQLAVQNGARAGAEAAAINDAPTSALAIARAKDEMSRTPGMNVDGAIANGDMQVTAVFAKLDGTACTTTPTIADPCWVTVRVRYTFRTVTPWPLIPNTANFDRRTTMRTIGSGS